jgi:hypothetical protein
VEQIRPSESLAQYRIRDVERQRTFLHVRVQQLQAVSQQKGIFLVEALDPIQRIAVCVARRHPNQSTYPDERQLALFRECMVLDERGGVILHIDVDRLGRKAEVLHDVYHEPIELNCRADTFVSEL